MIPADPYLADDPDDVLDLLEGIVFVGGDDVAPELYGAERDPRTGPRNERRDAVELSLMRRALDRDLPVLAICRGIQVLNVARGGTLIQHLADHIDQRPHREDDSTYGVHDVVTVPGSRLRAIVGERATVHSHHHQGIDRIGEGLVAAAHADPDGTVEGLEDPSRRFCVGVLWHPDADAEGTGASLFQALVSSTGMSSLWHPFADMAIVKDDEFVVSRGNGARVWDEAGREYIDAKGGLWYCSIGHGRGEIADAVSAQMRELAVYDIFASTANRPAIELADRVAALAPFAGRRRVLHQRRLGRGRHGRQAGAALLARARQAGQAHDRAPRAQLPRHERVRHQPGRDRRQPRGHRRADPRHGRRSAATTPSALERLFDERGDQIAAFIGEPVIGAGGIYAPARRLLAAGAGAVPRPRRAADRRRGDLRVRPARHLVRLPALRHHSPT